MFAFKRLVVFIQLLVTIISCRPFGAVIYDICEKYDGLNLYYKITFRYLKEAAKIESAEEE